MRTDNTKRAINREHGWLLQCVSKILPQKNWVNFQNNILLWTEVTNDFAFFFPQAIYFQIPLETSRLPSRIHCGPDHFSAQLSLLPSHLIRQQYTPEFLRPRLGSLCWMQLGIGNKSSTNIKLLSKYSK